MPTGRRTRRGVEAHRSPAWRRLSGERSPGRLPPRARPIDSSGAHPRAQASPNVRTYRRETCHRGAGTPRLRRRANREIEVRGVLQGLIPHPRSTAWARGGLHTKDRRLEPRPRTMRYTFWHTCTLQQGQLAAAFCTPGAERSGAADMCARSGRAVASKGRRGSADQGGHLVCACPLRVNGYAAAR